MFAVIQILSITVQYFYNKILTGLYKNIVIQDDINSCKSDESMENSDVINNYYIEHLEEVPSTLKSVDETKFKGIKLHCKPYECRYSYISSLLEEKQFSHFQKLIEFGCSTLNFVDIIKRLQNFTQLIFVDTDKEILELGKNKILPDEYDKLKVRENPLTIKVFHGCASTFDPACENADVVLGIELIQTMTKDVLEKTVENIFGQIKPELVIFTTPNKDFNPLFDLTSDTYRHKTHVYEWTRMQFKKWAYTITLKYPEYQLTLDGTCYSGYDYLNDLMGPITQIAVFHRLSNTHVAKYRSEENSSFYELIAEQEFYYQSNDEILKEIMFIANSIKTPNSYFGEVLNENEISFFEFTDIFKKIDFQRFIHIIINDGWIVDESRYVIVNCPYYSPCKV